MTTIERVASYRRCAELIERLRYEIRPPAPVATLRLTEEQERRGELALLVWNGGRR